MARTRRPSVHWALERLGEHAREDRLDKAVDMLSGARFQLFSEVSGDAVEGVIKSQSDPNLVYSCRLDKDGVYYCCTQNLFACGGLRGAPCKHLLLLLVGLAATGDLPLDDADAWLKATGGKKPALDKQRASATLLRYKGAEAGDIDWRPVETLPEDFVLL